MNPMDQFDHKLRLSLFASLKIKLTYDFSIAAPTARVNL